VLRREVTAGHDHDVHRPGLGDVEDGKMSIKQIGAAVLASVSLAAPAAAQGPGAPHLPEGWDMPTIAPLPEGERAQDPADLRISGAWIYATSDHVLLACDFPTSPGQAMTGHMEIAEHDGGVTATLVTGAVCDPPVMCIYEGAVEGHVLAVSNSAIVDGEGGRASNGWALVFTGPGAGLGSGTSSYIHPEGYSCSWSYQISLRRPEPGELD
jgi:hypothetical protein